MYYQMKTNARTIFVEALENGELFITTDGTRSINNAGVFINQYGGKEALLAKCEKVDGDLREGAMLEKKRKDEARRMCKLGKAAAEIRLAEAASRDYEALIQGNGTVEVTDDNVRIVMRYLNSVNWGGWKLPALSIGYSANQYDCDGHTATTIEFDAPVTLFGETSTKFCYGAPKGHLTGCVHIR